MKHLNTDIIIVGGGLAGLNLARGLHEAGRSFVVLDARNRFGGRILSQTVGAASFDMGPAWFWPGQPRVAALIDALGLAPFEQFSTGALIYEDESGRVQRGRGYASMEGSWRFAGGFGAVIDALVGALPADALHVNTPVTELRKTKDGITIKASGMGAPMTVSGNLAVLALPPRVAATMTYEPALDAQTTQAMQAIPTWMAAHAKAVAVYDTPFWREDGLSGDAMSRLGPLMELHDASPANGGPYAIFGFMGVAAASRRDKAAIRAATLAQLVRLFGPKASEPRALLIKDWAFDPHTATLLDQQPVHAHPAYGQPAAMTDMWQGRLHFGSTEMGTEFGGFIEGALEVSEAVLAQLQKSFPP